MMERGRSSWRYVVCVDGEAFGACRERAVGLTRNTRNRHLIDGHAHGGCVGEGLVDPDEDAELNHLRLVERADDVWRRAGGLLAGVSRIDIAFACVTRVGVSGIGRTRVAGDGREPPEVE